MRIESSVTSLSWIPSEAVTGLNKAVFGSGFTHYDAPPPDVIDDLEALRAADRFRFGNVLSAWIEVDDDGKVVDGGYSGGVAMGSTTIAVGPKQATFAAVAFDDIQHPVELGATSARFVQTVGGHTAVPAPRRVNHAPFVAFQAPTVWTTLALTLHADGRSEFELVGASTFPRHWVYDHSGALSAKAGLADFKEWWRNSFGSHTPWGDEESPALTTAVETALERELSGHIMRGGEKPKFRKIGKGDLLTEQGAGGDEIFLLLNGVFSVEVDGEALAEIGPGAILGERAAIEGGARTSTLRALTKAKVAVVRPDQLDRAALESISDGHRREEAARATAT
ncbi:MAG: cyclic nucleotide-binding domain-containing protein [Acidimicrobiia bacterium]